MSWKIKRKPVNDDETRLSKITATHIETGQTYFLKARMGTETDKKVAWDNIYTQHEERIKEPVEDSITAEGVVYLDAKEVK